MVQAVRSERQNTATIFDLLWNFFLLKEPEISADCLGTLDLELQLCREAQLWIDGGEMFKTLSICTIVLLGIGAQAAIFGVDDREAVRKGMPRYQQSRSVAISVQSGILEETAAGLFAINVDSYEDLLCKGERFANQPSVMSACTAFLVAPDLLVTAGHCVTHTGELVNETGNTCDVYSWLFDHHVDGSGHVKTQGIRGEDLYKCKQIVYAVKEDRAPFRDFALVQLDRPVLGRPILKLAVDFRNRSGDRYAAFGFPIGMPMTLSKNAGLVLDDPSRQSFMTNLDAFDGNSGGPVLNAKNEVVGILVGGSPTLSFVQRPGEKCERFNRCDESGKNCLLPPDKGTLEIPGYQGVGTEVQRIQPVVELIRRFEQSRKVP